MYNQRIAEEYDYRPLLGLFDIQDSEIEGRGLFVKAGITIPEGDITVEKDFELGSELVTMDVPAETHIEFNHQGNCILFRTPLGGFINHSDNPTARIEFVDTNGALPYNFYKLVILKELQGGDEVTVSYGQTKICSR